jgi:hypothetical protein
MQVVAISYMKSKLRFRTLSCWAKQNNLYHKTSEIFKISEVCLPNTTHKQILDEGITSPAYGTLPILGFKNGEGILFMPFMVISVSTIY